jgi:hypothetical protein
MQPDSPKKREYLYASELGTSFIDCFLKIKGEPYTNLPTSNARRKMEAGKVWESIVLFILSRVGILKGEQRQVNVDIPGMVSVHGKLDFLAGGEIDAETAREINREAKFFMETLRMPSIYTEIADRLISSLMAESGGSKINLEKYVLECKSVSAFVWDLIEQRGQPSTNHKLQTIHYMIGEKIQTGKVIYINRDDCRIREFYVEDTPENRSEYLNWLTPISNYLQTDMIPPLEPLMTFNPDTCKFAKNTLGVEWSRYLTKLYNYENPQAYRDDIGEKVQKINYVFKRIVNGDKITESNSKHLKAAEDYFPNLEELIELAQQKGIKEDEPSLVAVE